MAVGPMNWRGSDGSFRSVLVGDDPVLKSPPADGSVYAFRTRPYSEFAPQFTGRYGALKVLGSSKVYVVVAAMDCIRSTQPTLDDVRAASIVREHRFAHTGAAAIWGINAERWDVSELDSMTLLGTLPLSAGEMQTASDVVNMRPGSSFASMSRANYAVEGEWRWTNDREAFAAEHEQVLSRNAAKRAAEQERLENRLRGLTWEQLLGEVPLQRWNRSPPFPSEAFTREAREVVHKTCRSLQSLGPKPRKPEVRRLLRECVEWFNRADEQGGGVIETEEREDICAVLEEMAFVARQRSLVDEIDDWRSW
jgi:hypothetical protein